MEKGTQFIALFMSAVSNCLLYSKNHASVEGLIEKTFLLLNEIFLKSGALEMMIIENDLVMNRNPVREIGLQGQNLIKRFKRKGISHIHFLKGLTLEELKNLIADIATTEKRLQSSPHVKAGIVDVHMGGFKGFPKANPLKDGRTDLHRNISAFTAEQIEKAREEYSRISPFKQLHLAGFEEIVGHFVLMLKKEVNVLKLLRPVQAQEKYDETHATNVSVLTVFQAQAIGIGEEFHGDIGLAALLHDVGTLFIPRDMIERGTSPEGKERIIRELHPFYGAQYLAKIHGLTRLAPIVAFEHHLRYDGRGHPKLKIKNMKQHICSQMTAIADAFDTLRMSTPHKKALDLKDILVTMKRKDEGLFNPFLIDNFIRSIHFAIST